MINKRHEPVDNRDENKVKRFADEKTDEKIHRHLSDINDVISEEDIENVRTDVVPASESLQSSETTHEALNEDAVRPNTENTANANNDAQTIRERTRKVQTNE
ncbi:MAG: hypothetical protein ABIN94_01345 [Ferruginibacter sp.]